MRLRTYPNTPLWFDLVLATGVIALAYGFEEVITDLIESRALIRPFPRKARGKIMMTI